MRTPQESQDILENMENEIYKLKRENERIRDNILAAGLPMLESLYEEIASLKEQLKREQNCVDWYAEKYHWIRSPISDVAREILVGDLECVQGYAHCGGKLARATQARR